MDICGQGHTVALAGLSHGQIPPAIEPTSPPSIGMGLHATEEED